MQDFGAGRMCQDEEVVLISGETGLCTLGCKVDSEGMWKDPPNSPKLMKSDLIQVA